jgi:hypothetical protein
MHRPAAEHCAGQCVCNQAAPLAFERNGPLVPFVERNAPLVPFMSEVTCSGMDNPAAEAFQDNSACSAILEAWEAKFRAERTQVGNLQKELNESIMREEELKKLYHCSIEVLRHCHCLPPFDNDAAIGLTSEVAAENSHLIQVIKVLLITKAA